MNTNWRQLVLVAVVIAVFGAVGGYLGANFEKSWILPEGPSEFQSYLQSEGIPAAGRSWYEQWVGDQWLEDHPSYSGQDGKEWKEEALERRLRCIEAKASGQPFYIPGCF